MSRQELLVFQDKSIDKNFDYITNQMNILISKPADTEAQI